MTYHPAGEVGPGGWVGCCVDACAAVAAAASGLACCIEAATIARVPMTCVRHAVRGVRGARCTFFCPCFSSPLVLAPRAPDAPSVFLWGFCPTRKVRYCARCVTNGHRWTGRGRGPHGGGQGEGCRGCRCCRHCHYHPYPHHRRRVRAASTATTEHSKGTTAPVRVVFRGSETVVRQQQPYQQSLSQ